MMKPSDYELFHEELYKQDVELISTPKHYEQMHVFPNVYPHIKEDTPRMLTYPLHSDIDLNEIRGIMKRFMVKDYVKSVKGSDFPRCFDSSITQEKFDEYMKLFYKYRGDLLTGGICIKEFVDLKKYGDATNEYRVFYMNNEVAMVSRNSGQPDDTPEPPDTLIYKYSELPSWFYTVDFAELEDGSWIILETGDGGVSGLPDNQDELEFYKLIDNIFFEYTDAKRLETKWKCIGTCADADMPLFGLDSIGDHYEEWIRTRCKVLSDFVYTRNVWLNVYEIVVDGKKHTFACSEFCCNGGWAFALPEEELKNEYRSGC